MERLGCGSGLAPLHLPGVPGCFPVLLAGDVLLKRTPRDRRFVFQLHAESEIGGAENGQVKDVDEEAHEGQREREDADEESGRGSASAAQLPAAGLQQARTAPDQDTDTQIHHRIHQYAFRHPQPCVTTARDAFYAWGGL